MNCADTDCDTGSSGMQDDIMKDNSGIYGMIQVHLFRPFCADDFLKELPESVERIAVLDRTKEPVALGEPLYLDICGALYGKENPDLRITFDTGIRFRTDELDLGAGARGQNLLPPGGVLMEIKIPGAMPLWMARALDEMNIRQTSFSKIGTAYTNFIYEKEWGEARSCCKVS